MRYGKKLILFIILAAWLVLAAPAASPAATLDAFITADNAFNFFLGNSTGSNLRYIGRAADWFNAVSFPNVECQPGDYLYVAAWDQGGAKMFLAEFTLPGGGLLLTKTTEWRSYVSSNANPSPYDGPATLPTSQVFGDITAANASGWNTPVDLGQNDGTSAIWGSYVSEINYLARYIWDDGDTGAHYVLFRSADAVCPAPLPSALPLFASGLMLAGVWGAGRKFF